jgi:hypothetical protein
MHSLSPCAIGGPRRPRSLRPPLAAIATAERNESVPIPLIRGVAISNLSAG